MGPPSRKPPPSNPNKDSENEEDKKTPAKKNSPQAKHTPPSPNRNNNGASLTTPTRNPYSTNLLHGVTDVSSTSLNSSPASLINRSNVASFPCLHEISSNSTSTSPATPSSSGDDILARFGLIRSPTATEPATPRLPTCKMSFLKCCPIEAGNDSSILFRFEPNGTWFEYLLFKEVVTKESQWTKDIDFRTEKLTWYHLNIAVINPKNYQVRLFRMQTGNVSNNQQLIGLGEHICGVLNQIQENTPSNYTPQAVQVAAENEYFWIPDRAVWADVIGSDAAYARLIGQIRSEPDGHLEWYQSNKACIDSYFHSGSYSMGLARILGAPIEEVHPNARQAMFNPGDNDEEDVDPEL